MGFPVVQSILTAGGQAAVKHSNLGGTCDPHTNTASVYVLSKPDVLTSPLIPKKLPDVFCQPVQPVVHNLFLSFLVGIIPILVVLVLLGVLRRPAWQSALAGLVVAFLLAITAWAMPVGLAFNSMLNGGAFALWPVMWIVWNAMWLYNITVRTGKFDLFRRWMIYNVPADKRILLLIIGFSFGALLEGIAGFGTPVAIGSALLIGLGFPALEAVTLTLIFDTAPVAFGALGVPITTLDAVTGGKLGVHNLSAMVGRQLPFFAFLLPFYAIVVLSGTRGLRTAWPAALVAGASFALTQFFVSNFIGPELPDVLAALISLICTVVFVQFWKPRDVDQYRATIPDDDRLRAVPVAGGGGPRDSRSGSRGGTNRGARNTGKGRSTTGGSRSTPKAQPAAIGERNVPAPVTSVGAGGPPSFMESVQGWLPWVMVSVVVIIWTELKVATNGQQIIQWPGLHLHAFISVYGKAYTALYTFQILGTGTAILVAVVLTALLLRAKPAEVFGALADTWTQLRLAILTVLLIIALAYLYNYSGIAYTVGWAIAAVGGIFPFFSAFLGWIACFLSGSDTSSNALFGNLQVVAATKLKLHTVLAAATNSSGAVMSKMISPQSVTTGVSTTSLVGKEGLVVRRTFVHSIILASLLGILAMLQEYVFPGMIPGH